MVEPAVLHLVHVLCMLLQGSRSMQGPSHSPVANFVALQADDGNRISYSCVWCLQDYRVHIKHTDGHFEHVPYFSLPANDLTDVIAPSCYSCFDYPNALADLVCCLTQRLFMLFMVLVLCLCGFLTEVKPVLTCKAWWAAF